MSGMAIDDYFEKRRFRIDDAALKVGDQQNVIGNDLMFGRPGFGFFLRKSDRGNRRFTMDTARNPRLLEPAFASQDGVNRDAGLRRCSTVQETDSVHVTNGIKTGPRKTHPLIHLEKRAIVHS